VICIAADCSDDSECANFGHERGAIDLHIPYRVPQYPGIADVWMREAPLWYQGKQSQDCVWVGWLYYIHSRTCVVCGVRCVVCRTNIARSQQRSERGRAQLLPERDSPVQLNVEAEEGCLNKKLLGLYHMVGVHDGWPHFKNTDGHRIFRYVGTDSWRMGPGE
jgi:hypothetical protein